MVMTRYEYAGTVNPQNLGFKTAGDMALTISHTSFKMHPFRLFLEIVLGLFTEKIGQKGKERIRRRRRTRTEGYCFRGMLEECHVQHVSDTASEVSKKRKARRMKIITTIKWNSKEDEQRG